MINLTITYSLDQEKRSIDEVKNSLDWIREHGYKVLLPAGLNIETLTERTEEEVVKAVEGEYNLADYENLKTELLLLWEKEAEKVEAKISEIGRKSENSYNIHLTKYGFVGSYELPNDILLNISNRTPEQMISTIIHEIFHLSIEELIVKNKIPHRVKEKIVDLLVGKNFPVPSRQHEPENVAEIEKIFASYCPDIEKIITLVSGLK